VPTAIVLAAFIIDSSIRHRERNTSKEKSLLVGDLVYFPDETAGANDEATLQKVYATSSA
jgi:hypothetical protein